jgi:glycerol-3-phosphate dehydrogenase
LHDGHDLEAPGHEDFAHTIPTFQDSGQRFVRQSIVSGMRRDPSSLCDGEADLAIVGGGIYGLAAAWDAAQRGLSVVLVERGDFGGATSWNNAKTIHGGLRYLQHLDLARVRASTGERRVLQRIAPHLVRPLQFVMPTYGHGKTGPEALAFALAITDLLSLDRNRGLPPEQELPSGRVLGRGAAVELLPSLPSSGLTGVAIWHDAQLWSGERLAIAYLESAVRAGARAANYVEVTGLLRAGDRVIGLSARDRLDGAELEIRARCVLSASGPWTGQVLDWLGDRTTARPTFSRSMNAIVPRILDGFALGLSGRRRFRDPDAWIGAGRKTYFIAPWRQVSVIGTTHGALFDDPAALAVSSSELEEMLDEVAQAYPPAAQACREVRLIHCGLLPAARAGAGVRLLKQPLLWDHRRLHGVGGLISLLGVKFTTARELAERAVDLVEDQLGRARSACRTAATPLVGGGFDSWEALVETARRAATNAWPDIVLDHLLRDHGSELPRVLRLIEKEPELAAPICAGGAVIRAQVVHAVREEMAMRLTDVVLRRTDLGASGYPGAAAVRTCAELMAAELGWNEARIADEVEPLLAWGRAGGLPPT